MLEEHISKDTIPRGFDTRIAEIQEEHHQQTTQLQQATTNHVYKIQAIRYENVSLQGKIGAKDQEIAVLQRRDVGYFANEDKNNGMTITA